MSICICKNCKREFEPVNKFLTHYCTWACRKQRTRSKSKKPKQAKAREPKKRAGDNLLGIRNCKKCKVPYEGYPHGNPFCPQCYDKWLEYMTGKDINTLIPTIAAQEWKVNKPPIPFICKACKQTHEGIEFQVFCTACVKNGDWLKHRTI